MQYYFFRSKDYVEIGVSLLDVESIEFRSMVVYTECLCYRNKIVLFIVIRRRDFWFWFGRQYFCILYNSDTLIYFIFSYMFFDYYSQTIYSELFKLDIFTIARRRMCLKCTSEFNLVN